MNSVGKLQTLRRMFFRQQFDCKLTSLFASLLFFLSPAYGQETDDPLKSKSGPTDVLDSMISVTIVLFILSVITEKLTQLIRKYSPFIRPGNLFYGTWISTIWRNIRKQQPASSRIDLKIEREVNSLSFMIGLIISVLFCLDIFQLFFASDPRKFLYWNSERWSYYADSDLWVYRVFSLLVSFCLTAFFLTFGSKFFHDLLDSFLQTKNLKRKLVDENTYTVETIEQFEEFMNKTYTDLVQMAIEQNRNVFQIPYAVSPPMHGRMRFEGRIIDCIDLHVQGNSRGAVPQTVSVKLESGRTVMIKVNVIPNVEKPSINVLQGDSTANKDFVDFKGTICCKIEKDGKSSLLTCSHVLTGGTAYNHLGGIIPRPAQIGDANNGNFYYALCTDEFDIALVEPTIEDFTYKILPKKERRPALGDIHRTSVRVVCRNNVIKTGVIVSDRVLEPLRIEYKGNRTHSLLNLIVLSKVSEENGVMTYEKVTVPGDSGSCVYDEDDRPIGMIVAGNNKFSYAIPIVSILNKLSATLIKSEI